MIYILRYQPLRQEQDIFTMLIDLWCNTTLYNAYGDLQIRSTDPHTMLSFMGTSTRPTLLSFTGPQYDPYGDLQQGALILIQCRSLRDFNMTHILSN